MNGAINQQKQKWDSYKWNCSTKSHWWSMWYHPRDSYKYSSADSKDLPPLLPGMQSPQNLSGLEELANLQLRARE